MPPRFEPYGGTDPAGFVASSCVHRSLNPSQRPLIAAGFLAYERERMHVSGRIVDDAAKVTVRGTPGGAHASTRPS